MVPIQSTGNFEEYDFNIFHNSYADFNQIFVTDFYDFDDCSYNDYCRIIPNFFLTFLKI